MQTLAKGDTFRLVLHDKVVDAVPKPVHVLSVVGVQEETGGVDPGVGKDVGAVVQVELLGRRGEGGGRGEGGKGGRGGRGKGEGKRRGEEGGGEGGKGEEGGEGGGRGEGGGGEGEEEGGRGKGEGKRNT